MKKRLAIFISMILLITTFFACGKKEPAQEGESKKIVIGLNQFPDNIDPALEYHGWYVSKFGIGETLIMFDENMELKPVLADSWKVIDDSTYEFNIKDGVKFHNGKPVTAEAVKSSIERSLKLNKRAEEILSIDSIKAEGQKLTITTKSADSSFLGNLADPVFIIVDASGNTNDYVKAPVCTGPFKIKSFVEDSHVDVEKNKDYWDDEAKIDLATFKIIKDDNTRAMALQSGEIDVATNITSTNIDTFENNPKFNINKITSLRTVFAYENLDNEFLKDPAVRKAVALCFDRETYANKLLKGTVEPATGLFPKSLPYGKDIEGYKYDIDEAAKVLKEAGYVDTDNDGILEKDGKKLELNIALYTSRAELPVIAEALQAEFEKLGIKSKIQSYESLADVLESKDFDIALYSVNTAPSGDPESFLKLYFKTDGESNYGGYSNKEVDALIDKLGTEKNKEARYDIAIQAQKIILEDNCYSFIITPMLNVISSDKVTDFKMYPAEYYLLNNKVDIKK